jgi:hypothetical protein
MVGHMTLFNFENDSNLNNWTIVDDVVMGGRSNGHFEINKDGHGEFYGTVSTENNGGFSSVRYYCGSKDVEGYSKASIRLRGDGKVYQFRTKSDNYDRHSYVYEFKTSGEWEVIVIPFADMEPRFRGRKLNMPNYPSKSLEEIAFLIGNKKKESFQLEIDYIELY